MWKADIDVLARLFGNRHMHSPLAISQESDNDVIDVESKVVGEFHEDQ